MQMSQTVPARVTAMLPHALHQFGSYVASRSYIAITGNLKLFRELGEDERFTRLGR